MKRRPYIEDEHGCWIWQMKRDKLGAYGLSANTQAHRAVYERLVGPIPDGLELDHLCRVTLCVNPSHMEPVTHLENMRRRYADYTHCSNGHEFTEANTYIRPTGHRDCRECIRDRAKAYRLRKRAAA